MKPDKIYTGRSTIRMFNCDCMDLLNSGKKWDLAIVDPPYGISINMNQGRRKGDLIKHKVKDWDNSSPNKNYFKMLRSCSMNQIIWGANNFDWIPPHNGYIVWNKDITGDVDFSKAELAYCSSRNSIDMVKIRAQTGKEIYSNKIHPTQKPVKLYKWLLTNYAKEGDTILDTHGGSMSIAIACWDLGFDLDICELDKDYFNDAVKRFEQHISQTQLF
jgi:site-specific DNA-methyltransferase (adenine-specific)